MIIDKKLEFYGVNNTRDIGGYPTCYGKNVVMGRLIRSGAIIKKNKHTSEILINKYKIKNIIDFRTIGESERHPIPKMPGISIINNPILQNAMMGITRDNESMLKKVKGLVSSGISAKEFMKETYLQIVSAPYSREAYGRFLRLLLKEKTGATMFLCSQGRDRTGIATMLILSALGVSKEDIINDYLWENPTERKQQKQIHIAEFFHIINHDEAEFALDFASPSLERLEAVYKWIDINYGSVINYLIDGIGVTMDEISLLREMYLL